MERNDLFRPNAEGDFINTPISVLGYITYLERLIDKVAELSDFDELYSTGDMQDALEKINELCK